MRAEEARPARERRPDDRGLIRQLLDRWPHCITSRCSPPAPPQTLCGELPSAQVDVARARGACEMFRLSWWTGRSQPPPRPENPPRHLGEGHPGTHSQDEKLAAESAGQLMCSILAERQRRSFENDELNLHELAFWQHGAWPRKVQVQHLHAKRHRCRRCRLP